MELIMVYDISIDLTQFICKRFIVHLITILTQHSFYS